MNTNIIMISTIGYGITPSTGKNVGGPASTDASNLSGNTGIEYFETKVLNFLNSGLGYTPWSMIVSYSSENTCNAVSNNCVTKTNKELTDLEKDVLFLMREKYTYPQDYWNDLYNDACNKYGQESVEEEIISYEQIHWRELFRGVCRQIETHESDIKAREQKTKELNHKLEVSEKIRKAKEEVVELRIIPSFDKYRVQICKHAEQCRNPKCKFVHPKDAHYEHTLCGHIQAVLRGQLPLTIEWNCWHNQDGKTCEVHKKYGLCTDSHSEAECNLAKSDRTAAEIVKKNELRINLDKLIRGIHRRSNSNIQQRKPAVTTTTSKPVVTKKGSNTFAGLESDSD